MITKWWSIEDDPSYIISRKSRFFGRKLGEIEDEVKVNQRLSAKKISDQEEMIN